MLFLEAIQTANKDKKKEFIDLVSYSEEYAKLSLKYLIKSGLCIYSVSKGADELKIVDHLDHKSLISILRRIINNIYIERQENAIYH